jgi:hypothetical protein
VNEHHARRRVIDEEVVEKRQLRSASYEPLAVTRSEPLP